MEPNTPPPINPEAEITHLGLLSVILVLIIAIAGVAWYIYTGMQNTPAATIVSENSADTDALATSTEETSYSTEEKLNILQSLESNPDGLTTAEKRAVLEQMRRSDNQEIPITN